MILVNPASNEVKAVKGNNSENKGNQGNGIDANSENKGNQGKSADAKTEIVDIADIKKEFVLYLGDDAFWGMEIDNVSEEQTPVWVNPTLKAKNNDYVRFHLIALGTDIHQFQMTKYQWLIPGTSDKINKVDIGPLAHHQFTVKTKNGSALYMDKNESNKLMGMSGTFVGSPSGGTSEPGVNPFD